MLRVESNVLYLYPLLLHLPHGLLRQINPSLLHHLHLLYLLHPLLLPFRQTWPGVLAIQIRPV